MKGTTTKLAKILAQLNSGFNMALFLCFDYKLKVFEIEFQNLGRLIWSKPFCDI